MSFSALNWACSIRDASVSAGARHVLLTLAQFADEAQTCFPSHATLAAITNLSEDTVQRRLKDLVEHGLVFVVKRKNNDGRRLTNYYVLLVDAEARAHALAHGWEGDASRENRSVERTEPVPAEALQPAGCGLDQPAGETEPCRRGNETNPQLCGIEPSNNHQGTYPPTPQGGREGGASQIGQEASGRPDERTLAGRDAARMDRWAAFERLWPWDATELPGQARSVFMRLSDDEQQRAIDAAPGYAAACKTRSTSARNHGMAHARKWLAGEGWNVAKARSVDSAASIAGRPFPVRQGSEQAAAWAKYETALYGAPRLRFIQSASGLMTLRPTEWPPPLDQTKSG